MSNKDNANSIHSFRFENKTVIVTGAGSGIGRAVVIRLVAEGASVLAIDVNQNGLEETKQLTSHPDRVTLAVVSVVDEQQVIEKVNQYVEQQGHLDVLINMAGIFQMHISTEVSLEEFRNVIDINLVGTFLLCRTCLPHLLKTKGAIVNTASIAGLNGHPYMAAYAASKGAVISLTKTLAREYIYQGVRVNAVAPGGTNTPMIAHIQYPAGINQDLFQNLTLPGHRLAQPDEIAGVIVMLASSESSFINGEVIRIDGGIHS